MKENDLTEVFTRAKESTVYAHAMVYIQEILKDNRKTEQQQFKEIQKVVSEAQKHLS